MNIWQSIVTFMICVFAAIGLFRSVDLLDGWVRGMLNKRTASPGALPAAPDKLEPQVEMGEYIDVDALVSGFDAEWESHQQKRDKQV